MKIKPLLKVTSALLSVLMLVSSAQTGITAFAAELEKTAESDRLYPKSVSQAIELEGEIEEEPGGNVGAVSDEAVSGTSYSFDSDTGTLTITGEGDMTDYTYSDSTNKRIPWYYLSDRVKKVVIEEGVTSIGSYSFNEFKTLEEVEIKGEITKIGERAFYYCSSLKTINIPDSVTVIGKYAFYSCESLTGVNIPYGITVIENSSFDWCKSLKDITIPDSVTTIDYSAFSGCESFENIEIPDSVTEIKGSAFYCCSGLKTVKMSKNVTKYSNEIFRRCSSLEEILIPDGVTEIGSSAFESTPLKSVALPDGLEKIGDSAFSNTELTKIFIPNSVTTISDKAFIGLSDLTIQADTGSVAKLHADKMGFNFESTGIFNHEGDCGENATYFLDSENCVLTISGTGAISDFKVLNSSIKTTTVPWIIYKDYVKKVVIEEGITEIGAYTFCDHSALKEISYPKGITKIGESSFEQCSSLESITIPDGVVSVGNYAFRGCAIPEEITIPDSVTDIGRECFKNCKNLCSVKLPGNIENLQYGLFYGCDALTVLDIPDSVTSIGSAFSGMPKTLTVRAKVGSYAKLYCDSQNIAFESTGVLNHEGSCGENVTYFLDSESGVITFSGNGATESFSTYYDYETVSNAPWYLYQGYIKKAVFEDGITKIGSEILYKHKNLTEISLPDGLTEISNYAFEGCTALESVDIPDSVTKVGKGAFSSCTSLKSVKMSNTVTKLEESMFSDCLSLESFEIPVEVTEIKNYAFYNTAIKKIEIPDVTTSIGNNTFPNGVTIQAKTGSYAKLYAESNKLGFESTGVLNHEGKVGNDVTYFIDSQKGVITFSGTGDMYNYSYSGWSKSDAPWAIYKDYIKEAVVEEGVTSVGEGVFRNCKTLKKVTIADSIVSIKYEAFKGCDSLQSVVIPENAEINAYAFLNNSSLTAAVVPESVTFIGYSAFSGCKNLTIFGVPNSKAFEYAHQNSIKFSSISGAGNGIAICETGSDYYNMTLRISSEDGESVYSRIIDENSVNAVYGIDTEKTYTVEICGYNGIVFCKKSGVKFDDINLVNVSFENTKKPLNASIELLDENGALVDGFTVKWTDGEGKRISSGKSVSKRIDGEKLGCEITLGNNLACDYQVPEKAEITLSETSDNKIIITLEKLPDYIVSGFVTDSEGNKLSGVEITAVQNDSAKKAVVKNTETDENGNYSLQLKAGDYQLLTGKKGYYDKKISGSLSGVKTENIELEKLSGAKLLCSINSSRLKNYVSASENTDNLSFTVFNQTENKEISDFTYQNDYFWFCSENVSEGDALRFDVKDKTGVLSDCQVTMLYSEGSCVKFDLIEKGVVLCKIKSTQNDSNVMVVFDGDGKYVETDYFKNLTVQSSNLSAGSYKIALMGESEMAFSAANLGDFNEYGLAEGEDYILYEAEVMDGKITELGNAVIPGINYGKLGYLEKDGTKLTANSDNVAIGQFVVIKAEYIEKNEYITYTENEQMIFEIPENLSVGENSVTVNGVKTSDFTVKNNILTVNLSAKSSIVRVCLTNVLPAEKVNVSAKLRFDMKGSQHVQPIGSVSVKLGELDFYVTEKTAQTNITTVGTAFPDSEVRVYDNGKLVGSEKANKVGSFSIPFELNKPFTKSKHQIYIEMIKSDGTVVRSQTKTVSYDENLVLPTKITMCGILGHSYDEKIMDFMNPNQQTVNYMLYISEPIITFKTEFNKANDSVSDVVIFTTDSKGRTTEIPAVYDEESKTFVGSCKYDYNTLPAEVSVGFRNSYDHSRIDMDSLLDSVDIGAEYDKAMDMIQYFAQKEEAHIWKDPDGTKYMGFIEDDAYSIMSVSPDDSVFTNEMYYLDGLLFTDKIISSKKDGKTAAEAFLKGNGYNRMNTVSASNAPYSMYIKITDSVIGFAMADNNGDVCEKVRTFSNEYLDAVNEAIKMRATSSIIMNKVDPVGYKEQEKSFKSGVVEFLTSSKIFDQKDYYDELMAEYRDCMERNGKQPDDDYNIEGAITAQYALTGLMFGLTAISLCTGGLFGLGLFAVCSAVSMYANAKTIKKSAAVANLFNGAKDTLVDTAKAANAGKYVKAEATAGLGIAGIVGSVATSAVGSHIDNKLEALKDEIDRCEEEYKYYGRFRTKGTMDPSGFICEAVESNRVEGVTCTLYYSPNADGSDAVEWDASEFSQENPLISDAMGYYEWYVPEGWWQVRYEKDGYAVAYSDWLPVPPPQTEVNIAMTSLDSPKVKDIYVYQNEIDIEFTQYMNTYTVSDKTFTVSLDGENVSGKLVPVNPENGFEKTVLSYATKFRFVSESSFALDDKVKVSISGAANYAENTIADFENTYSVMPKPEKISANETVISKWKDTAEIRIQAEPKEACANKKITVTSNSLAIAEVLTPSVTTDENGCALVKVKGVLPGEVTLEYRLENSDCSGITKFEVQMPAQKISQVRASAAGGSTVEKGTKIELFCDTKGADIYYTTDLSCPCNLTSDSRIKYTEPIEITEYTTIIAYAVKEGMEDAKPKLFIYNVKEDPEKVKGDTDGNGFFNISDATYLQEYFAELIEVDEETASGWDFDGNGSVDISDATFLQMVLAELKTF